MSEEVGERLQHDPDEQCPACDSAGELAGEDLNLYQCNTIGCRVTKYHG